VLTNLFSQFGFGVILAKVGVVDGKSVGVRVKTKAKINDSAFFIYCY